MFGFDPNAVPVAVAVPAAVIAVILLEWILPLPYKHSPANFCHRLGVGFQRQLLPKAAAKQIALYGALSLIVFFAIIGTLIAAVLFIAPNDVITQGILFYLALGYQDIAQSSQQTNQLLDVGQKSAAKSSLKITTDFDVEPLSELGLRKLMNENLVLRFFALWLMPTLLFILFDGLAALLYRALFEIIRCWSANPEFSKFARTVNNLLELIPTWVFAPLYSVFKFSGGWLKLYGQHKKHWRLNSLNSNNQLVWLCIAAQGCKTEFAGPVKISGNKFDRPRLLQGKTPTTETTNQLLRWHNQFRVLVLMLILLTSALLFWVTS